MEGNHVVDGRDLGETRRNNFGDASSATDTALEHVGVLDVGKLSENGGTICDASSATDTALEHVGVLDVGKLSENGRQSCRGW
eukprot:scaffold927_cov67-Skeletonema_dohrnii-CCMP3373.AAC.3